MYESLATLLEGVCHERSLGRAFLLFVWLFVESTSVDLTPWSHHQPQGVSPRLFCFFVFTTRNVSEGSTCQRSTTSIPHRAIAPRPNQALSTKHSNPNLKQPPPAQPAHRICASSTESAGGFDRAPFFDYVRRPRSVSLGNLLATNPSMQIRPILRSGFSRRRLSQRKTDSNAWTGLGHFG